MTDNNQSSRAGDGKTLTDEQIDLIAADGMRNAAGGIYETSVHQFARACITAATQELQARITSLSREAWEWSKALEAQLAAAPAVSAPAELPLGVVVSAYRVGDGIGAIKIERAQQIQGPDLWAVRRHGDVLNHSGEWEWEPMPSSRDDEFLARCRFDTHTAAIAALYAATSPAPATADGGANG